MEHTMKLRDIYFEKIKNNEKIYEIRLNDEKRKKIKIGDKINFFKEPNLTEKIETQVCDLIIFNSFDNMTDNLNAREIGFDNSTKQKIIDTYQEFYSHEDEEKYGVLAIKLKLINH